jgi:hypothetical protein
MLERSWAFECRPRDFCGDFITPILDPIFFDEIWEGRPI